MNDTFLDLPDLLESWLRRLRAERKSAHTLRCYRSGVESYVAWCAQAGLPAELNPDTVTEFVTAKLTTGQVSTVRLTLTVLKVFARWIADEEGIDMSTVTRIRLPKADDRSVPDLSENEVARLLKACEGTRLSQRRDMALIALFAETGLRAAEMVALDLTDIDIDGCVLHVKRGKGGKGRRVRFSVGTAAIVDRYLRTRKRSVLRPSEGPLWVSNQGTRLTYRGMASTLKARAVSAGVIGFHMHRLRHTAAVRWLRHKGTETGLRAHAGWTSNTMIARYVKAASEQLAGEEFDRLDLGVTEL